MKRLLLIRHGETDYTAQKRYCGQEDIPLNAKGIEQASRLNLKLQNIKVDRIYSSDLKRAFQTARIAFKKRTIIKNKNLREINFGKFCGLTYEEAERLYPDVYKIWVTNPADIKIPGGESLQQFEKRVLATFRRIANQNPKKNVAIVSHGGPIRIILLEVSRLSLDKFWEIEQDAAALNIIEFQRGSASIHMLNNRIRLRA